MIQTMQRHQCEHAAAQRDSKPFASGRVHLVVYHECRSAVAKLELTDKIVAAVLKRIRGPRRFAVAQERAVASLAQII